MALHRTTQMALVKMGERCRGTCTDSGAVSVKYFQVQIYRQRKLQQPTLARKRENKKTGKAIKINSREAEHTEHYAILNETSFSHLCESETTRGRGKL